MHSDDPDVRAVLRCGGVARVATLSPTGIPALTPLWFIWHAGQLHLTTAADSLVARNLRADPAVVLLVTTGEASGAPVLRLHGQAVVRPGLPPARILLAIARRHYLAPAALPSELAHRRLWSLRRRYYAQAQAVTIVVTLDDAERLDPPHL